MNLRDYQRDIVNLVSGDDNALIQADTGAGKTIMLAEIAKQSHSIVIAHRNLLIAQLSAQFASFGVDHAIYASDATRRHALLMQGATDSQKIESSACVITSLDKLIADNNRGRMPLDNTVSWQILVDEAHHMIDENKWGRLMSIFPKARIVGATATPVRLDGISLEIGMGGCFHRLVQAPSLQRDSVKKLIQEGYISAFKCYGVDPRINFSNLELGRHDYTKKSLGKESERHVRLMAGDAVKQYLKITPGSQAVAFCVTIETAKEAAKVFRDAGISAAAIHSKMGQPLARDIFRRFRDREINVLANVDMIGEGIDVPAIETAILMRKTASFGLFRQWCGRTLRPSLGKDYSVILDHVDNIRQHGLPDRDVKWTLNGAANVTGRTCLIHCPYCGFAMQGWLDECPECGELIRAGTINDHGMQYIDVNLVELHRSERARRSRESREACSAEDIRYIQRGSSSIARTETRIAEWFLDGVKEIVSVGEIERFMLQNNKLQFWAKHFKLSDIGTADVKKRQKVLREYLNT